MSPQAPKAVVSALNTMFKGKHFSICVVDDCMKVVGAVRTSEYEVMRLYHCRDFADMDAQTKKWLFEATMQNVMNVDEFPEIQFVHRSSHVSAIEDQSKPRDSFFSKLFWR